MKRQSKSNTQNRHDIRLKLVFGHLFQTNKHSARTQTLTRIYPWPDNTFNLTTVSDFWWLCLKNRVVTGSKIWMRSCHNVKSRDTEDKALWSSIQLSNDTAEDVQMLEKATLKFTQQTRKKSAEYSTCVKGQGSSMSVTLAAWRSKRVLKKYQFKFIAVGEEK